MEAEKLRAILASPPNKLEKTASRIGTPLPVVKQLRVQALNLLMGRCVLCSEIAPMGVCPTCRKGDPDNHYLNFKRDNILGFSKRGNPVLRVTRERFLRQLDPSSILIRQICESCDNIFSQSVDVVVKNLLNYGRPYLAKVCRKCSLKRRRLKTLPTPEKVAVPNKGSPSEYVVRPFADSKTVEKMRRALGKGEDPKLS